MATSTQSISQTIQTAPAVPAAEAPSVVETVAPELVHDFTVAVDGAEKAVHLRRRLPLRVGHALPKILMGAESGDWYDLVGLCRLMIESWDLDGDPADQASYEDLDALTEIPRLVKPVLDLVKARLGVDPKA